MQNVSLGSCSLVFFAWGLMFKPVSSTSDDHGTRWLELFALFMLRGGRNAPEQEQQDSHLKLTLAYLFKAFTRQSKALLR